jgi:hypothetical protein
MLDRLQPLSGGEDGLAASGISIQLEDVARSSEQALHEREGEYGYIWSQLQVDQQQALLTALENDGIVNTAIRRSDGSPLFKREDLYNITTRLVERPTRLTWLFTQWLRMAQSK